MRWGKKDATLEEIKHVCKLACADEFIEAHKDKYNYVLDQGGTNVSGGQKQRLCIARALLKSPKVLVLDDSTSAVDTKTDAKIRKNLSELLPDVTKIIITQRIASVENADKIIVMDKGKVVDFDTPKNLLKNNKIYQEIYTSQKKGVL
jgi:ATP-binding cassette subfamily B protein